MIGIIIVMFIVLNSKIKCMMKDFVATTTTEINIVIKTLKYQNFGSDSSPGLVLKLRT